MIIVADDLTGANDTGVQFAKLGHETVVSLVSSGNNFFFGNKVSVINTDGRSLSSEDAYKRSLELAGKLNSGQRPLIFKKVDSTLRGNIGREIDGFMDEISFAYCAVAPAYPKNGRITVGGYHIIRGELLEDSELSKDVKFPMTESFIPALLSGQTERELGLITIQEIRRGEMAERVHALKSEGAEIIIFDSATDKDLKIIADFLEVEENVLWVGSAALVQAFAENQVKSTVRKERSVPNEGGTEKPVLTVAGSVSKVTREQVAYQQEQGAFLITIHPLHLLENNMREMKGYFDKAKEILKSGEDLVITTLTTTETMQQLHQYTEETGINNLELGNRIAFKLGDLGKRLIYETELAGLILTGGDIAYQTCMQLDVTTLEVIREIEEGIPLSKVIEGPHAGMPIVTKAGAFGGKHSLQKAIKAVKEEN